MEHLDEALLHEYLDGLLDQPSRLDVEAHLLGCSACSDELAALQTLFDQLAGVTDLTLTTDVAEVVVSKLEASRLEVSRKRPGIEHSPVWTRLALSFQLGMALVMVVGLWPTIRARLPAISWNFEHAIEGLRLSFPLEWEEVASGTASLASEFFLSWPSLDLASGQWILLLGLSLLAWLWGNRLLFTYNLNGGNHGRSS